MKEFNLAFKLVIKRLAERPEPLLSFATSMVSACLVFKYSFPHGRKEDLFFAILLLVLSIWIKQHQNHDALLDTLAERNEKAESAEEAS